MFWWPDPRWWSLSCQPPDPQPRLLTRLLHLSSSGSIGSTSSADISAGTGGGVISGGGVVGAVPVGGRTKTVHPTADGAGAAVHVRCDAQPGYWALAVGGSAQSGWAHSGLVHCNAVGFSPPEPLLPPDSIQFGGGVAGGIGCTGGAGGLTIWIISDITDRSISIWLAWHSAIWFICLSFCADWDVCSDCIHCITWLCVVVCAVANVLVNWLTMAWDWLPNPSTISYITLCWVPVDLIASSDCWFVQLATGGCGHCCHNGAAGGGCPRLPSWTQGGFGGGGTLLAARPIGGSVVVCFAAYCGLSCKQK